MQTKLDSLVESVTNVLVGYLVALGMQYLIFPLYDIDVNLRQHLEIGIFFMMASVVKAYVIRRIWNKKYENRRS